MPNTKKVWQTPKLIILARGRPEEFVLAGCKVKNNPVTAANKQSGCIEKNTCRLCKAVGTS